MKLFGAVIRFQFRNEDFFKDQATSHFDEDIREKDHFWMETIFFTKKD
jgi:hypothetical protein